MNPAAKPRVVEVITSLKPRRPGGNGVPPGSIPVEPVISYIPPSDGRPVHIFTEPELQDVFDLLSYTSLSPVSTDSTEAESVVIAPVDCHVIDLLVDRDLGSSIGGDVARVSLIAEVNFRYVVGNVPDAHPWEEVFYG